MSGAWRTGFRAGGSARLPGADPGRRDEAAFGRELHRALPRLRRYALAVTGSAPLADDMVQDCLERAWARRDGLDSVEIPFSWLRTILHNAHIDWLRRNRKDARTVELSEIADTVPAAGATDRDPVLDLARSLQRLNVDQRRILVLAGIEGLTYQEIADELSVPLGTVMSRLARARGALRTLLDQVPDAPARASAG